MTELPRTNEGPTHPMTTNSYRDTNDPDDRYLYVDLYQGRYPLTQSDVFNPDFSLRNGDIVTWAELDHEDLRRLHEDLRSYFAWYDELPAEPPRYIPAPGDVFTLRDEDNDDRLLRLKHPVGTRTAVWVNTAGRPNFGGELTVINFDNPDTVFIEVDVSV